MSCCDLKICLAVACFLYFMVYVEGNFEIRNGSRRLDGLCDKTVSANSNVKRYFDGLDSIYRPIGGEGTCLPIHKECGWPVDGKANLPTFVLSVGLEGAGHHLWTEILDTPVFDCVWINGRHYNRDISDGVPRTSAYELKQGMMEQLDFRKQAGKPPCKSIYDAEDSFPTGAIRKSGRVFMRPDIVNLQRLDGILFNVKYLIIARNVTDTAMSALRRNFVPAIEPELRAVEHTLTYLESALRGVPCHRIFIAHYEHALADPMAYIEPLSQFLQLDKIQKDALTKRLSKKGKMPSRKAHKLTQYRQCKDSHLSEAACYQKVVSMLDEFFGVRSFMWPTFAANGFDFQRQLL